MGTSKVIDMSVVVVGFQINYFFTIYNIHFVIGRKTDICLHNNLASQYYGSALPRLLIL